MISVSDNLKSHYVYRIVDAMTHPEKDYIGTLGLLHRTTKHAVL